VAEPPRYLTEQAERDAFALALATLPANVVRASDINAVARWAVWLNIWVQCKSSLGSKKTKPDRKFDHKRMSDAEQHLIRLENHLGLTPSSRNAIVHRLFAMPGLHVIVEGIEGEPAQAAPPPADDESPLGWLLRKGKSHSH
jgi:phage terminase small subunit